MVAAASASTPLSVRRLPLTGAVNCRDLGGYLSADGRRIKSGLLFRSDSLAELTDEDVALLNSLSLRAIVDLRGESERVHKPNRAMGGDSAATMHVLGFMPHLGEELLNDTRAGRISVSEIAERVSEMYRRFASDHTHEYSQLLHLIAEPNLPLLYHCTSGRDRTGFGTAVVLMALGVPRETIASDYAASNQYRRDLTFQIGSVDASVMATLTHSNPVYLQAAFDEIGKRWGSEEAYLRQGLGLSAEHQQHMQQLLLEPA